MTDYESFREDEWIQTWINERLGVPNTFNTQLLIDFQGIVERRERERIKEV